MFAEYGFVSGKRRMNVLTSESYSTVCEITSVNGILISLKTQGNIIVKFPTDDRMITCRYITVFSNILPLFH